MPDLTTNCGGIISRLSAWVASSRQRGWALGKPTHRSNKTAASTLTLDCRTEKKECRI